MSLETSLRQATLSLVSLLVLAACGGGSDPSGPGTGAAAASADVRRQALTVPPGTPIPADAHQKGLFGAVRSWPLIAVHATLMADGRVLSYGTRESGQQTAYFIYDIWNPADSSHLTLSNTTQTDIFCSSQVGIPGSNSVFIAGGDNWTGTRTTNTGNNNSNVLDGGSNALARGGNMNRARWYSSSTVLPNGEIYIQGGTGGTDYPEIRAADGSFRLLSGASTAHLSYDFPRNFVAPNGRIFGYDTAGRMYTVNPGGQGTIQNLGQFNSAFAGSDSSAAMFAPGRILQFGGNSNQAAVIDINGASPSVTQTGSMLRQRRLSVATLLADGQVLATGGSRVWNEMVDVSYEAEIWNPSTGQWTAGARAQRSRLYHGNALLLPDASVLIVGGGAPGPENNTNAEIYYPPYLFKAGGVAASRPTITAAPTVVDTGRTVQISVTGSRPISRVGFVKNGSGTHGFNLEQRFVQLPFAAQGTAAQGQTLSVQIPSRAADIPPGMWMLFAIDDTGAPSVARLIRVNVARAADVATAPTLASPGNQAGVVGTPVSLALAASDPNGDRLRYSASGLPAGLQLDPDTGRISGTPSAAGTASVMLGVSDGFNSANVTVGWTITNPVPLVLAPPAAVAPSVSGGLAAFTASATGQNVRYRWDFGDGTPVTSASASGSVTHRFATPGTFYVTAIVQDDRGAEQRATFLHNVHLPLASSAPSRSTALLLEPRPAGDDRLWVVNPDNDSVSVFDSVTRTRLAEIPVGRSPRTLALAGTSAVWVTNQRGASISVIDTQSLAVTRTIAMPRASQPWGIVTSPAGGFALVTLAASGQLLKLDLATRATLATVDVGAHPQHLALDSGGTRALVSRFITPPLPGESTTTPQAPAGSGAEVRVVATQNLTPVKTIVLAHGNRPDAENQGRGLPNYLGATAISPDGTQAWVPSKLDNVMRGMARDGLPLNFQNTVRAVSSRVAMDSLQEDLAARIDHDNASLASAAAFDPYGVYLFVALETSREVAVIDAHRGQQLFRIGVGRAPQALAVAPDRRRLYVSNFMDRSVDVIDLSPLVDQGLASARPLATLATVGVEKLSAEVFKGKQLFYDAKDTRLARDSYMSCASCHQDGGHDGRVWDLTGMGEGLRNTISLRGRGNGHGRLHWSGNFDEVQDFEGQIRGLAGGTGLMADDRFLAGTRREPLGLPKAGQSTDLDALAAYVNSLTTFDPSPARTAAGGLSATAQRGSTSFAARCSSCHAGAAFSDSDNRVLRDIGTIKASSGQRLGLQLMPGADTPTLRDAWDTAPYLHDGSAPTLEAAIRGHVDLSLTAAEVADLAEYVRQIGSEEARAPGAGSNLIVRAIATLANAIGAFFEVRVNEQVVGRGQLDATGWVDLAFDTASFAAGAGIDVIFGNDALVGGEDRNLGIQSITLNGSVGVLSTSAGVMIDAGRGADALDGQDSFEALSTGGWLPWDGAIRFTAPPAVGGGSDRVTVRAAGTSAGGVWPVVELRINGQLAGSRSVTATPSDLVFEVPPVRVGDRVDVVFVNDELVNGEDRNLVVEAVTVRGSRLTPATPGVTIDIGSGEAAWDGLNVVAGDLHGGWVPWNAAMRFTAPATGTDTIDVRARATLAGGVGAVMQVWHQGVLVGTVTVGNTQWQDFRFTAPAVSPNDRIDVVFTNDATLQGEDRNLIVGSVTVRGQQLSPTDASAVLDAGVGAAAFDGADTVPASSFGGWIPWDGALRLRAR